MFPHSYFASPDGSYFPDPYFPEGGEGEPPPPVVLTGVIMARAKGVSHGGVFPSS